MKVWVDDIREAPEGYLWAKSVEDAKDFIIMSEASMSGFAYCEIIDVKSSMAILLFDWLKKTNRIFSHKVHT